MKKIPVNYFARENNAIIFAGLLVPSFVTVGVIGCLFGFAGILVLMLMSGAMCVFMAKTERK